MATDVFISHSSIDSHVADAICAFLESRRVRCWMAPRDILPGEEWGDSILRGIQDCRIMVLIFSKSANDSGPVRSEVDRAVNARKVLIPFRIENVAPTGAMEFHIGRRHWLEAYQPPMEKHLELLGRAVRDALKTPVEREAAAAVPTGEGTLPTAPTASGRHETTQPAPTREGEGPLRLLLNFNHLVITGYPSTFQIVVENQGTSPLEQIEIVMESRGLERGAHKMVAKLLPGQSQRHLFEIEPIRSGNFVLQATIKCRQESKQLALVGSRSLRINEAPKSADILSGMAQLQRNSEEPSTTAEGAAAIGNLIPRGSVRTLNDLLDLELPDAFELLELTLDYEISMRALAQEEAGGIHRLQIPGAFLNESAPAARLKLEPMEAKGAGPEIRLVANPTFVLGRSREESDYLLWFWPRTEVNDQKTRRISKKHCIFTAQDTKLFVSTSGANRTILDGREINANENEPLERRGILAVAGIYFLDVTPFVSEVPEGPQITNIRNWQGPNSPASSPRPAGSVRFLPMTRFVLPQNSTWFFTDGAFGTSRSNPVIIDIKGLAEIQGRFHHHLGCFWIETTAKNGAVSLDGTKLEPGFIAPLVEGQILKLADKNFKVTVTPPSAG
jgi:hypothetical protein